MKTQNNLIANKMHTQLNFEPHSNIRNTRINTYTHTTYYVTFIILLYISKTRVQIVQIKNPIVVK